MNRTIACFATVALAVFSAGCSLFSDPVPASSMRQQRAALNPITGEVYDGDVLSVGNEWAQDNVTLHVRREYQANDAGVEQLAYEDIFLSRSSDPKAAAQVAVVRAQATANVTTDTVRSALPIIASALAGNPAPVASTWLDIFRRAPGGS